MKNEKWKICTNRYTNTVIFNVHLNRTYGTASKILVLTQVARLRTPYTFICTYHTHIHTQTELNGINYQFYANDRTIVIQNANLSTGTTFNSVQN